MISVAGWLVEDRLPGHSHVGTPTVSIISEGAETRVRPAFDAIVVSPRPPSTPRPPASKWPLGECGQSGLIQQPDATFAFERWQSKRHTIKAVEASCE
jgi:hypothetical protein